MTKRKQIQEVIINQEAAKWCFERGYKIYPKAIEFKETKYKQKIGVKFKWSIAIWSVYNYLYDKHNGRD